MAAPHVSGAIALMLQVNPVLRPKHVVRILSDSAKAFSETGNPEQLCTTENCGAGILDVSEAARLAETFEPSDPVRALPWIGLLLLAN